MLRTTKNMKEKYEKIQNYIFSLIPEKWEEIYLYASAIPNGANAKSGELFFYYLPKGILKMRPINVYEVPNRFNINEEQYLKIVEELYKCIKSLQQDFIDTDQEVWTNVTISIANFKFKVEYKYYQIPSDEEEIYKRNVIWKYKYLKVGGDSKEDRKILDDYYTNMPPIKKEIYEKGLYLKTDKNIISFDKEENSQREFVMYEKDDISNFINKAKNKFHNNAPEKEKDQDKDKEESSSKNQILNN